MEKLKMGFGAGQYKKRLIILHVEDQLDFFHVIRQVLEQMPGEFSVLHARTYAEAIELAGKYYFDCIFIDINLPDGNGLDLFAEIKGLHPHARGVIVSGANEEEFVGMAGAVGIDAYLIKPVQLGALYDTLKNLFPEAFEKAQMAGSL
ncbi:MAG: response regulator, partial [Verrucomicrobiae bacterium]|nr:response regulator [Verrucomicrobiae bacterium]